MYVGAVAGIYLFGIYGCVMLLSLIIGWSDSSWSERLYGGVIVCFLGLGLSLCLNSKNEVLKRQPIISSCASVGDRFMLVDSTLRCKNGEAPRYTVIKKEAKMMPNEQTPCENCGKTMIHHYDISCTKTDEQLNYESLIDWMNAPL